MATKITPAQIAEWKKEYFAIYQITGENDEIGILSFPNWAQWKMAVSALEKGETKFVESLLNNCWIYGDESIKTNYAYFDTLKKQLDEIIDFGDATKKKVSNHYEVTVKGAAEYDGGKEFVLKLKPVTIEHVNTAERNSDKSPFSKAENLVKLLLLKDSKSVFKEHLKDKNPYYYVPLLSQVEQLFEKKVLTVKKL